MTDCGTINPKFLKQYQEGNRKRPPYQAVNCPGKQITYDGKTWLSTANKKGIFYWTPVDTFSSTMGMPSDMGMPPTMGMPPAMGMPPTMGMSSMSMPSMSSLDSAIASVTTHGTKRRSCPTGYARNRKSGRCRKKDCKSGKIRDKKSGKCRSQKKRGRKKSRSS